MRNKWICLLLLLVFSILALSVNALASEEQGQSIDAFIDGWISKYADQETWLARVNKGEVGTVALPAHGDISQAEALRFAVNAILRIGLDIPFTEYGPVEFAFYEARSPVDFALDNHRHWQISFYPPDPARYSDICYVAIDSITGAIIAVSIGSRG